MNEIVKKQLQLEDLKLKDLQRRSRFDMFVVLNNGVISWFPGQKRSFCYIGNKFTDDENKMLRNLINILINKGIGNFKVVIIYDNDYHFQNENRTIVKISAGVTEKNLLENYKSAFTRFALPVYLKK